MARRGYPPGSDAGERPERKRIADGQDRYVVGSQLEDRVVAEVRPVVDPQVRPVVGHVQAERVVGVSNGELIGTPTYPTSDPPGRSGTGRVEVVIEQPEVRLALRDGPVALPRFP